MKIAKQKIAIVFCSVLLMIKPAYAGIPVLDLGESPTTFKEASNAMETLNKVKSQLNTLKENLRALGESLQTIAEFGQALSDMLAEIQEIADVVCNTLNDTLGIDIDLNEKLADALSQINDLQSMLTDDLVNQVTGMIEDTANMVENAENALQTAEDIKNFADNIDDLGDGNFLDKVNAVSEKMNEANGLLNDALDELGNTGLVDVDELRDTVNLLNEQQANLMNIANNGVENWSNVDALSGDIEGTIADLRATLDDLDAMGIDTSEMREALDQAESAYQDVANAMEQAEKGMAAWEDLKGELDKVASGEVWDALKEQYGDDKNFWDVMHDVAANAGDVAGNLDAVLAKLEEAGIDTSDMSEIIQQGMDAADIANKIANAEDDWNNLMADVDKVTSGEVWDKLKEQYGDDKNFWDVMHDIAANVEDVSGNLEGVLAQLEEEGYDVESIREIIEQGKDADNYVDQGEKGYNDVNKGIKEGLDFLKGKNKNKDGDKDGNKDGNKEQTNSPGNSETEIEEEEEEVVVDNSDDIEAVFNNTKEESSELVIQLNDTFDEALNSMNKGAALSQSKLTELSEALRTLTEEDIDAKDKASLEKRLGELIEHSQKVSDWGVSIAENAKERYNREYKDKILDGINNYQKVVQAYKKGNATKDDVTIAGATLKKTVSGVDVTPDKAIMVSYKREVGQVVEEARKLSEDIKKAIENKQKSS